MGCDTCGQVSRGAPGHACPRCDVPLRDRKPQAIVRSWALLITAAILYIPANIYPVMTVIRLGQGSPSTILGGVQELIEVRMWPLALLVLVASILVPMFKLLGLGTLLVMTQWRSKDRLIDRTRLFRIVDFVGRWSMIDVFMLSILTALVRMGFIASVTPGYGAVAFASVVVLTMLAALSFDPRLMWDAAEAGQRETEQEVEDATVVQA
jgi:paraquat-inducible protein A